MTLGIGTMQGRRQPARTITAVYPARTRQQRRLLARQAGHAGRLVAVGVALIIAAVAVFGAGSPDGRGSAVTQQSFVVPEARGAPMPSFCEDMARRSGLCSAYLIQLMPQAKSLPVLQSGEELS